MLELFTVLTRHWHEINPILQIISSDKAHLCEPPLCRFFRGLAWNNGTLSGIHGVVEDLFRGAPKVRDVLLTEIPTIGH